MPAKSTSEAMPANPQEIARIRDILLGPHIREYDQRFQQTARDLDRLRMDIEKLTEQLHEQAESQARSLDQQVQRLQSNLASQEQQGIERAAEESSHVNARLTELGGRLDAQSASQSERLKQEAERLDRSIASLDSSASKKLQSLQKEMRQSDDDLRKELRDLVDRLTDEKTDRRSLGQMLVEIGSQLSTGGAAVGLDDLLAGLGNSSK